MSVRDDLLEQLRRVAGPDDKVHIVPWQDNVDVLDRPTIMLKQQTIAPLAAPRGGLRIDYILTFIHPALDPQKAEADLDDWVPAFLDELRMNWFVWTTATKVAFSPINMAYDVSCSVLTTLKNASRKEH